MNRRSFLGRALAGAAVVLGMRATAAEASETMPDAAPFYMPPSGLAPEENAACWSAAAWTPIASPSGAIAFSWPRHDPDVTPGADAELIAVGSSTIMLLPHKPGECAECDWYR